MKEFSSYAPRELESEVLSYWEEAKIPAFLTKRRKGAKKFFVLDGPPYINALPHVGHVKTTAYKDIWTRLKYMQGFDAHLQAGFDCHGLPVEVIVEKELGITSKQQIIEKGIDVFDAACLAKILNNEKSWLAYYKKLGAWRAFFTPYFTYKPSYIESGWWTFKQLHEKGFVTEGLRSIHWCPHCETALSGYEVSDSYKNVTDASAYAKFRVKGSKNEYLVAWTTTPWTLPGNVAIAVAGKEKYVKARVTHNGKKEVYIIAKKLVDRVLKEKANLEYEIVCEFLGEEIDGLQYEPLLATASQKNLGEKAHRVYLSIPIMVKKKYKKHSKKEEASGTVSCTVECLDCKEKQKKELDAEELTLLEVGSIVEAGFCEKCDGHTGYRLVEKKMEEKEFDEFVTMHEGTGLVHTAPGHGQSDNLFGKHYGLPAVSPVDEAGKFTAEVEEWHGKFVKSADKLIIAHLQENGKLLLEEKVTHAYPLCWRCKSPLIFRLSNQIYFSIDAIKERMMSSNESVNWMPEYGKEAFGNWVAAAGDWCISQQRFWGMPIPLWKCEKCGANKVIGSVEELQENATKKIGKLQDLHRHVVDKIELKCVACSGIMKRIPDIFNVWYDSGIAAWASLGYPKENKELFESMFPVDLVNESQDQIRGWFYSLSFCSHAAFAKPAYKNVAMMGWVLDEKGEKMSKSLGNVVSADEAIEKLGADAIRLYFCWEISPWDVQKFSFNTAQEVVRSLNILWNSYKFLETYAGSAAKKKAKLRKEDEWILSRTNSVCKQSTQHFENFEFHLAGRTLVSFAVNDLSRWYIKLIRDRASGSEEEKAACMQTLRTVLNQLSVMMAPITPFLSDYVYQKTGGREKSVHFENYPVAEEESINKELEKQMSLAMLVTEAANSLRNEQKMKLRWPLAELSVTGAAFEKETLELLASQNNVLKATLSSTLHKDFSSTTIVFEEKEIVVALDVKRDEKLITMAKYRELIRAVQASRKQNNFVVQEKILLAVATDDAALKKFLQKNSGELAKEVGASKATVVQEKELKGNFTLQSAESSCSVAYERA